MFFRRMSVQQVRTKGKVLRPFAFSMCAGYWIHRTKLQEVARQQFEHVILPTVQQTLAINLAANSTVRQLSFLQQTLQYLNRAWRLIELLFIFSPTVILFPFRFAGDWGQRLWISTLVSSVERAGVVFIKGFQYLSHRRDIVGEKVASQFSHLRENAPLHSFEQTCRVIQESFGKPIDQVFERINPVPIASGSISQVYEGWCSGQKVAIKVRHPNVDASLERDIDILFGASKLASVFNRQLNIPITRESLKKTLTDQLDLRVEAENLQKFGFDFRRNEEVNFPKIVRQNCVDAVLVESFVEGKSVSYYQQHKHLLNKAIARIGAIAFFQMLMKNNFIHADCHGGNIFVQIEDEKPGVIDWAKYRILRTLHWAQQKVLDISGVPQIVKDLLLENQKQLQEIRLLQRQLGKKVGITMIDAGIVLALEDIDKINFSNFLKSLIKKEPEECAKQIYALSIYQGQKLIEQTEHYNQKYYQDLKALFTKVTSIRLQDMQGLEVLRNMLDVIRSYSMRLDGAFATILTNMLVLEQIARDLNPDINMMKCAVFYFKDI